MKTKTKLGLGFGGQVLLATVLGIFVLLGLFDVKQQFSLVIEHDSPVIANARQLAKLVVDMETGQRGFCIVQKEEFLAPYFAGAKEFDALIEKEKKLVSDNPSQVEALNRIEHLVNEWKEKAAKPEIAARRDKHPESLRDVATLIEAGTGKTIIDEIRLELNRFIETEEELSTSRYSIASETALKTINITITILVLALGLGVSLAVSTGRSISIPLTKLVQGAERIGSGELDTRVDIESTDEIGNLARTFNTMARDLRESFSMRKEADESLLREKQLTDEYINSLPGLFYVFDEKNRFVKWNKQWEIISGYSADEISQMYGTDFFEDSDKTLIADRMMKVFVDGAVNAEAIIVTKQGKRIPYYFTGLRKDIFGKPHLVGLGIDITTRRQAEEEKANLENQLLQAQKMEAIGTLAGGIAHDFNNMLGIILGNSELATSGISGNLSVTNNIEEIRIACLRARDMVKQILDFSRQTKSELHPIEIGSVLEESLKLVRPTIPASIEIKKNISNTLGSVMSDPAKLNQILLNLCVNAAHAMKEEGGVLEVGLEKVTLDKTTMKNYHDLGPGDYIELRVSDTGCGIDHEIINRIFDPYFTTKGVGEGTGMGLAVIHGIVKEHNGDIKVISKPGKGTSFYVLFPVVEDEVVTEVESEELLAGSGEKILFIDDEKSLVFSAKYNLEGLGYEVVTEQDPVKALNVFEESPESFDLIITDMAMPEMTGLRLSEKIMEIRPDIPIIICSGFNERTSEEKAKELGIKVFLLKPYLLREMATTIRLVLDKEKGPASVTTKRILVVDDEEPIRTMLRKILEDSGYEVSEAPDGKVALWIYKVKHSDLIITDLIMPEKEGIETISELKRDYPEVKIIAISGGGRGGKGQYLDMAKKFGADNTLAKPFEKEELLKTVKDLLG